MRQHCSIGLRSGEYGGQLYKFKFFPYVAAFLQLLLLYEAACFFVPRGIVNHHAYFFAVRNRITANEISQQLDDRPIIKPSRNSRMLLGHPTQRRFLWRKVRQQTASGGGPAIFWHGVSRTHFRQQTSPTWRLCSCFH